MDLCQNKDVFAVVPTGGGKSTLILGPVLADMAEGKRSVSVTLVPTKTLADDQVRLASKSSKQRLTRCRRGLQIGQDFFKHLPCMKTP
jgi:superfamily II DNA helicase RecQ